MRHRLDGRHRSSLLSNFEGNRSLDTSASTASVGSTPAGLLQSVRDLRSAVARDGRAAYRSWRLSLHKPAVAGSMLNLAHYLALRHRDLRPLQDRLALLGLSSLGRVEGHVLASLDAVEGALAALADGAAPDPRRWPLQQRHLLRGQRRLYANTAALLGPTRNRRETRIMVTLPSEAADGPDYVLALVRRGADVVRINCAHDDAATWIAMASHAREAGHACGRAVPVLMDIAGPKLRTGAVRHPDHEKRLRPGDALLLVPADGSLGKKSDIKFQAVCDPPEALLRLEPGAQVAMDDGALSGVVEERRPNGCVVVRVQRTGVKGFKLKPEKGLNFPGVELGLKPLSAKDLADLDVIAAHADLVGHSFVQSAEDVAGLQAALQARRSPVAPPIGLIAKIETVRGVRNLPGIIVQAAGQQPFGVMIARGDLAVEIGFARLAEIQEEVLWLCEAAQVPVVWATQVLESMVKSGLPTRGEMTDAAMSGRAECVMLNKGPNVGDAIDALDGLLVRMAEHQTKKTSRLRMLHSW